MQKPDTVAIQCSTGGWSGHEIICLRLSEQPMEVKAITLGPTRSKRRVDRMCCGKRDCLLETGFSLLAIIEHRQRH